VTAPLPPPPLLLLLLLENDEDEYKHGNWTWNGIPDRGRILLPRVEQTGTLWCREATSHGIIPTLDNCSTNTWQPNWGHCGKVKEKIVPIVVWALGTVPTDLGDTLGKASYMRKFYCSVQHECSERYQIQGSSGWMFRLPHCVQKKTPTHIFFHISMSDV